MADITRLRRKRQGYLLNLNKHVDEVETMFTGDPSAVDLSRLGILREKLQNYESVLSEIIDQIESEIEPENLDAEITHNADTRDKLWETQAKISQLISKSQNTVTQASIEDHSRSDTHSEATKFTTVRLPKLDIAKLDGNALHWQEFWDYYESTIHKNPDLSPIDKFKYLKTYLAGDSLRVVEGFRLTAADYETVVETLSSRFGNKDVAATYDDCEKHIRSLVALGIKEETFGQVFTPIILSKLPRQIRVELHRKNGSNTWTLSSLRNFFRDELKARELSDWSLELDRIPAEDSKQKPNQSKYQSHNKSKPLSVGALANNLKKVLVCSFCNENHYADKCQSCTTVEARKAALQGNCFKCLGPGHSIKQCTKTTVCYHCKGTNQHSSLCYKKFKFGKESTMCSPDSAPPQSSDLNPQAANFTPKVGTSCLNPNASSLVLLQMAVVTLHESGIQARIFLDTGSSRSYITSSLFKAKGVESNVTETASNSRFGDSRRTSKTYPKVDFQIITTDGSPLSINALVVDSISCPIHKFPIDLRKYPILREIKLADSITDRCVDVSNDILIGSDYYYQVVESEQLDLNDGLVLLRSKFGYITAGTISDEESNTQSYSSIMFNFSQTSTSFQRNDIERFWSLEDIGIKDDSYIKDDELALKMFNDSIEFVNDRYQAKWPWKPGHPTLPESYDLALNRLRTLSNRNKKDPRILGAYDKTIKQQIDLSIIEQAPKGPTDNLVHYLPHHVVVKPDSNTTKIRIVYDASAKASKDCPSLNECILRGPVLIEDLCKLLLRFRTFRIAMCSDIEKAFLQVVLHPSDRDVTRFYGLLILPNLQHQITLSFFDFKVCRLE